MPLFCNQNLVQRINYLRRPLWNHVYILKIKHYDHCHAKNKICTSMFINYRYMYITTILPRILTCNTHRFVLHDLLVSKSLSNINPDNEAIHLKQGDEFSTPNSKQSLCNRFHDDTVSFYFTLGRIPASYFKNAYYLIDFINKLEYMVFITDILFLFRHSSRNIYTFTRLLSTEKLESIFRF